MTESPLAPQDGTPSPREDRVPAAGGRWRMPVLMYHSTPRVGPQPPDQHTVPVAELSEQLSALSTAGWQLLGLTEALSVVDADPTARVVAVTFDDGFLDFLHAFEVLRGLGARATMYVPTETVGQRLGPDDAPGSRLDWAELAEVQRGGIEIGSHSVAHRPMDVLPPALVTREVRESKQVIEDRLGAPVTSFCFPHGYTSPRVGAAVRDAGYTNACIVGRRIARSTDDVFALPRLHVRPGVTGAEFDQLVARGEPGIAPYAKRVIMPMWRLGRRTAFQVLRRELT